MTTALRFAPVTLGFEGRARTLPLLSLAIAFRFQPERVARALRTLIGGVPEKSTVSSPPGQLSLPNDPALGRGGKGGSGERSGTLGPTLEEDLSERERSGGDGGPGEGATPEAVASHVALTPSDPDEIARRLAAALDDHDNVHALRKLARTYPPALIHEALRRTRAIPPERIRKSPAACFTGILRALARSNGARTDS